MGKERRRGRRYSGPRVSFCPTPALPLLPRNRSVSRFLLFLEMNKLVHKSYSKWFRMRLAILRFAPVFRQPSPWELFRSCFNNRRLTSKATLFRTERQNVLSQIMKINWTHCSNSPRYSDPSHLFKLEKNSPVIWRYESSVTVEDY